MTGLVAGADCIDITPHDLGRTWLAGFGPNRRAEGVLEPLTATSLHLAGEGGSVTLVSLDLIALPRPWVERIRERVHCHANRKRVLVCATHTHSGPDTLGLWGRSLLGVVPVTRGVDPAYMECLVEEVAACVDRAAATARPVRLRAASFEVPERWTRNDRRGGARFDHATALALDDAERGSRLATLVCYASHPETLWRDNRRLSPDFPGAFRRRSRALAGGTPLYLSGPLGAMLTPNVPPGSDLEARKRFCEALGHALAEQAEATLADAPVQAAPALAHAVTPVRLRKGNWRLRLFERIGFLPARAERDEVVDDVHWLRVGELELLATPGELAPEVGTRLRDLLPARHRMVVSLCDDEIGYVLEPHMWTDRAYRYERSMSLGPETAARLLEACRGLVR